jgi:hypothetical protein
VDGYLTKNRKLLRLLLYSFLFCSLFPFTAISASVSSEIIVPSQGKITYSMRAPNLAIIPEDWHLTYGTGPQLFSLDYSFYRTVKPSIKSSVPHIDGVDPNNCRECDGTWYHVKPGDHIVASVWIYCGDSTSGYDSSDTYYGGKLGMDFYVEDTTAGVWGVPYALPRGSEMHAAHVVKWGTKTWTQVSYDVTVPSDYFTSIAMGNNWPLTYKNLTTPLQISHVVLWVDVRPVGEIGTVWFADAEFFINP